jgi:hypothetical protein
VDWHPGIGCRVPGCLRASRGAERPEGGIFQASVINSAAVSLREHLRCAAILRKAGDPMNAQCPLDMNTWLAVQDRIVKHKASCDSALARLGIDVERPIDPYEVARERERARATISSPDGSTPLPRATSSILGHPRRPSRPSRRVPGRRGFPACWKGCLLNAPGPRFRANPTFQIGNLPGCTGWGIK